MPLLLIANWRALAALVGFLLYTATVWHAHTIYDRSKDADRLEAGQEATHAEMKASFKIDEGFNQLIADLGTFETRINRSIDHETPLPDCRLGAGRVSALRQAIAGDPAAR